MKLTLTSCLVLWNFIVSPLAEASEPQMESLRHIKISITQGKTAILPCMVSFRQVSDEDRSKYSIVWRGRDDRILTINERVKYNPRKYVIGHPYPDEWNLKIIRVRKSDSGEYRCSVNSDPVQAKVVQLVVHVPPRIYSSKEVKVRETERLVIYCNATGDPLPEVTWYKDNQRLIVHTGEKFVIERSTRNDSGLYSCEAHNGIDPADSDDINVDVLYAPTVQLSTRKISQHRYKSIVLDCHVIANPVEKVTWYKNGKPLNNNWKYKIEDFEPSDGVGTHSLEIRYLERLDFGDYICMAVNDVGTESKVVAVVEITTSVMPEKTTKSVDGSTKRYVTTTTSSPGKTSTSLRTVSSRATTIRYAPSSPKNGELVVSPSNDGRSPYSTNTILAFTITAVVVLL